MNRKTRNLVMALVAAVGLGAATVPLAQTVSSVRGADVSAPELAPGNFRQLPDSPPIPRDYVQQPPLVPHKVDGYEVSLNFNKCMDCHAWSRYQEAGATKVSLTHFKDRDGGELSNVSPRRYFCLQCHVPQTDARPLVENTFRPAAGLR
ncbi:nitrate reductase cytochrome c-type subunit [Pseudothauera nasutitermitis]|uniref:Periplasmic nitrate reductase, electron transfer subunit n=1 Tax=Pseudothauera nasutitermitis TaxID=2565930 RepID=A0A4S4ANF9_9RHOO|nr:nitrate reductase cytochrome c-type subunit [Pseudothauera nasutitermitis]THF61111.1 nitrate reductase cytochrome c-type subunit [Pseudothauera nasutitermitis]